MNRNPEDYFAKGMSSIERAADMERYAVKARELASRLKDDIARGEMNGYATCLEEMARTYRICADDLLHGHGVCEDTLQRARETLKVEPNKREETETPRKKMRKTAEKFFSHNGAYSEKAVDAAMERPEIIIFTTIDYVAGLVAQGLSVADLSSPLTPGEEAGN